jgi:hypothetical protein
VQLNKIDDKVFKFEKCRLSKKIFPIFYQVDHNFPNISHISDNFNKLIPTISVGTLLASFCQEVVICLIPSIRLHLNTIILIRMF